MHQTWTLTKRELRAYFDGPAAYVALTFFLAITGWFFGSTLFLHNLASLRSVFTVVPFIFLFFIPALIGISFNSIGTASLALWVFVAFYLTCPLATWWWYRRQGAEVQCD